MKRLFFTDGGCSGNPGPGGWAAVEFDGNKINKVFIGRSELTTNNRMELSAIIAALKEAEQNPEDEFIIYSDSAYAVNAMNSWISSWARNGWVNSKKKQVENLDLMQKLYEYKNILNNFKIEKVDGHSNIIGNELADAYATMNKAKISYLVQKHNLSKGE